MLHKTLQPELQYNPRFRQGVALCSFDITVEPGAVLIHEWRSGFANRRIGPRLIFRPDELLVGADETFLMPFPADEWLHIEIECGLGRHAQIPAVFRIATSYAGQIRDVMENVPCVHRRFRTLDQCLFIASTDEEATHSLDNIRIALHSQPK